MFWLMYILFCLFFVYLFSNISNMNKIFFYICLVVLLTPAQIEVGSSDYGPALFTFLFNTFLEQNYSMRVLRPFILSLPISLLLLWIFLSIKRRFF